MSAARSRGVEYSVWIGVLRCTIENLPKLVNYFDAGGTRFLLHCWRSMRTHWALRTMRIIVLIFLVAAAGLFLAQRKLMYFPRKYPAGYVQSLAAKGLIPIHFATASGTQWA